jgi:hypothetical protein
LLERLVLLKPVAMKFDNTDFEYHIADKAVKEAIFHSSYHNVLWQEIGNKGHNSYRIVFDDEIIISNNEELFKQYDNAINEIDIS